MARDAIVHDVDLPSLEYDDEETAYMATETPSFDADDATLGSTFVIVDEDTVSDPDDDDDGVGEEDDVSPLVIRPPATDSRSSSAAAGKVKFLDKIREHKSYQKLARIVKKKGEEPPVIMSPDSGINELQGLSLEEQEKQKEEWQQELNKVEEEIKTLREVLGSKVKASQELRRKLGYTVWQEISEDVSQSLRNVKESNVYQKTESVVKTTAEKATTIFGGFGSGLTTKLGQIKNSESFRSFEEKVGSALENVKTKVASRSNSMQNFDEILEEETRLANEEKRSREEREAATK
ncbi:tumor protein D52-like isoform X6 [Rhopalosiphum maidis]|uniref:tumor protein D52-like isoform X5 n=1 Tax=Rhopalosiphum maidis TaxID=43146 RepID=UPI000EFE8545|nr:tumor protein D52-like isoform X5 [Rhopalosiphum maidis]XP_026820027.1 tumor protein D52-like isoform X6 [Rhopalosiphum maidis]